MTLKLDNKLTFPNDWTIHKNEFADLDGIDLFTEDLLYISKNEYHLDLGNNSKATKDGAKLCIHLFRGDNWNCSELLEKFCSTDINEIIRKLNTFINNVDTKMYNGVTGYLVNENDDKNTNSFTDFDFYSVATV